MRAASIQKRMATLEASKTSINIALARKPVVAPAMPMIMALAGSVVGPVKIQVLTRLNIVRNMSINVVSPSKPVSPRARR